MRTGPHSHRLHHGRVLRSLPPARRRLVFGAVSLLLVAVIAITVAVAVHGNGTDAQSTTADQATPGPVLLVPGYGGSTAGLNDLAATLRRHRRLAFAAPLWLTSRRARLAGARSSARGNRTGAVFLAVRCASFDA